MRPRAAAGGERRRSLHAIVCVGKEQGRHEEVGREGEEQPQLAPPTQSSATCKGRHHEQEGQALHAGWLAGVPEVQWCGKKQLQW